MASEPTLTATVELPAAPESAAPDREEWDAEMDSILPLVDLPGHVVQLPLYNQCWRFPFFLLGVMAIQCFFLNFVTMRMPPQWKAPNDLLLDIIPEHRSLEHITDICLYVEILLAAITIGGLYLIGEGRWEPRGPLGRELLRRLGYEPCRCTMAQLAWIRFWLTFAVASLLRTVTILATTLPSLSEKCRDPPHADILYNTLVGVGTFGGVNVHCGDMLFSGHTVTIVSAFMVPAVYGPLVHFSLRYFAVGCLMFSWYTILASRSHYTDDILVAIWVCVTLFWTFRHDQHHGAPRFWQLFIQTPMRLCRRWSEYKARVAAGGPSRPPPADDTQGYPAE